MKYKASGTLKLFDNRQHFIYLNRILDSINRTCYQCISLYDLLTTFVKYEFTLCFSAHSGGILLNLNIKMTQESVVNPSALSIFGIFILTVIIVKICQEWLNQNKQPPGPFGFPLVGHLPILGSNPSVKCMQLAKKYGDIFRIRMGSWPTVVLNSRTAIREALVKQSEIFSDRPEFFSSKVTNDMRSLGFGSYTPRWRLHSKIASTVLREFASPKKPTTEQIILMEAEKLVEHFIKTAHETFNPHEEIFLAVGSVIYQICYGMDKNCRQDKGYMHLIKNTKTMQEFAGAGNPFDVMPWLRFIMPQKANQFVQILKTFRHSIDLVVKEHIQTYDENHLRDVTDGLIHADLKYTKDSRKNHGITKSDIFSTLQDFLGGGFDTSSTTLEWIILYLGHYTDIQLKIQKEIEDVIGSRSVTLQDMGTLPFTEATILEVQRISPVVSIGIPHAASSNTVLRNYEIKKGTVVLCNFYSTTRDSTIWENPDEFLPQRFLDKHNRIIAEKEEELLTFSTGRRRCPGDFLAKMELFLFVVNIFQKCKIKLESDPNFEGIFGLTYGPKPYLIKVNPRQ